MLMSAPLHYKMTGEGPVVVLLHGLFGSLENLGMVTRELAKTFKVISLDLPDHGQSYHSENFSYESYASAVLNTLKILNIDYFDILGHSMGGKVAMKIALSSPDVVRKLIVADIAPVAYEHRHKNVLKALASVTLQTLETRQQADSKIKEVIDDAGVRQFLLKSLVQVDGRWSWKFNVDLITRDYQHVSAGIDFSEPFLGETLFIKGSESDYLTASHQQAVTKRFPKSKARVIQGAGHWLHAEKPVAFNKIVRDFLTS